jgi:hypothetical protein
MIKLQSVLEDIKLVFAIVAVCGVGWLRQAASETVKGCLLRLPCPPRPHQRNKTQIQI